MAEAAVKYRKLNNPGAYVGPWKNETVPYMVEPMEVLTSRDVISCIFVGPAQTAKTDALILNWIAYGAKIDPMDMIIYCPTQAAARDFSTRRIDRLNRHSPEINKVLIKRKDSDNKFDKQYTTGMLMTLSWPSVTELAGKPCGRIALTDYDRMPDDVEGDGSPFDLANKRTTTFGSFAMTMAESSPSRPILDPRWVAKTKHEAPPTTGILALYNRGDRRKLYWPCPDCGSYFEGQFKMLTWEDRGSVVDSAKTVRMVAPCCDYKIHPDQRYDMLQRARWLKDGQTISSDGVISGAGPNTPIASFWMNGTAAAFVSWQNLVRMFIDADTEFQKNGSEEALKKFYNNDLGEPYLPKSMTAERLPEALKARAEDFGGTPEEPVVPDDVRLLIATVDVQKNRFEVQVLGVAPGTPFDLVVIDRFPIVKSERVDDEGDRLWVKPGTYLEDWDLITEQVLKRTYPLADGSGRRMMIKVTGCDSGGKEGVTTNAYNYYRKLREQGLAGRFHLLKGDHTPNSPRTRITFPDSSRRDVKAAARGDVPVLLVHSNSLKDLLSNRLDCIIPGKGMVRFSSWLPDWFYAELCAERREDKGWTNPLNARNEAWDLCYYALGLCVSSLLKIEAIDWTKPPSWCGAYEGNPLVLAPNQEEAFAKSKADDYDFSRLGKELA